MGCGSCSTGSNGKPAGCKSNGGCSTGGCNKLNTYDWLGNMLSPDQSERQNIYEIRFKNTRKAFYVNVNGLSLITGDYVVVESDRGYDLGQISLGGVLAKLQMKKRKVDERSDKVRKIYRLANTEDLKKLEKARSREQKTLVRTRKIIEELNLDMKLSDVEFQGDNTKAIFYYIADQRVDFRELIKVLANEFRIRVEMKQIGLRHESGLVGGIGSCGRELCCSTWLTDFKSVSTSAARYQNLSLNPMKISGQCGRLKCCLNFELETYLDALKNIPEVDRLETELGRAYLQKTDIFKRKMWFSYEKETAWHPLDVDTVVEIIEMNKKGEKPSNLKFNEVEAVGDQVEVDFVDVVGQATLNLKEDRRKRKKRKKGGSGRSNSRGGGPHQKSGGNQRSSKGKSSGGGRGGNQKAKASSGEGSGNSSNKPSKKGGDKPRSRNSGGGGGGRRQGPKNQSRGRKSGNRQGGSGPNNSGKSQ